jgi:hypothetical protein
VQLVATELKPEPVKVNTVLIVPEVGVTTTSAVTLKNAYGVRSFTGVPLTASVQLVLVVAYGLTTKLPCAIPGDVIEQVEEVSKLESGKFMCLV